MTCWQIVVLPDDSGPKMSVIRPRGMPPTPSARSSAIDPVGITSIAWIEPEPSFMIEPVPNCFSMVAIAAATALVRSAWARSRVLSLPFRSSAARSPINAMGSSRSCRWLLDRQVALPGETSGGSTLVGVFLANRLFLARLPDQLGLLRRRLRERRQPGLAGPVLGLLLLFLPRTISRRHRCSSELECRLPTDHSRGLHRVFTAARPTGPQRPIGQRPGEGSG